MPQDDVATRLMVYHVPKLLESVDESCTTQDR